MPAFDRPPQPAVGAPPGAPGGPSPTPEADSRAFGGLRLLRRIATGGMSTVYAGYDPTAGRPVAVKVLSPKLARKPEHRSRFQRESRFSTLLDHPHIVRGLSAGQDPATDKLYLVLELVEGPTAQELLDRSGPMKVADAARLALDIARALEHLHTRNLVHRDIKPDNILISPSGIAKVADLGLVKRLGEDQQLTAIHEGFGTSYYMPYEQALNAGMVDGRSDLFALGATIYHLLTGTVPFTGADHHEVVERKAQGWFESARSLRKDIPPVLDQMLSKLLARDPRSRYQTASELIVDLERSRLAAELPSFADREQALRDPLMRARLTTGAQPTQPNLQAAPSRPSSEQEVWFLRYKVASGSWRTRRATTRQVLYWGRSGRLPGSVLAARAGQRVQYRPLRDYPEFRSLPPTSELPTAPPPSTRPDAPAPTWRQHLFGLLVGGGVLAAVSASALYRVWSS